MCHPLNPESIQANILGIPCYGNYPEGIVVLFLAFGNFYAFDYTGIM